MTLQNFYKSILLFLVLPAFAWLQVLFFGSLVTPGHILRVYTSQITATTLLVFFVRFFESQVFDSWTKCHYARILLSRFSIYLATALLVSFISTGVIGDVRAPSIRPVQLFCLYSWFYVFLLLSAGVVFNLSRVVGKNWVEKIILGKYHVPVVEECIFMFVDLSESTLISHLLGDRAFSYLIKDFFREIDSAVSHHGGTIYQYAGDEMLIHWPSSSTKYYEEALNAFEELSASLVSKETKYKKLYGLSPRFKAALHSGKVVVTWVGQSKKEILYQGEVLNVTARITELAKRTGYSLVVSQAFFDGLGLRNKALKYAGNFPVRGLETKLPLYGYTSLSKQKNRWFEVESSQN